MAWNKVTKEELKEAGLDIDDIKTKLAKLDSVITKEDISTTIKTEIANANVEISNSLKALEGKLNATPPNRDTNNNGGGNNNAGGGNNNGQPQPLEIDPVEFMSDPTGHVRKLIAEGTAGVQLHSLGLAAEMAYNTARQRLPFFEKFETEILEEWKKYPVQLKSKPDVLIENIYNLIKGRHLEEIITDTNKKEGKYNLVQPGGTTIVTRPGGGSGDTSTKPEDQMTPDELKAAKSFGMTPAEWVASKGGLKYA